MNLVKGTAFAAFLAAGVFNVVVTHLRFPTQFGPLPGIATFLSVILAGVLLLKIKTTYGFFGSSILLLLTAWHWGYWGVGKLETYKLAGSETWAGDGIGIMVEGMMFVPLFLSLLIATVVCLIQSLKAKKPQANE